MKAPLLLLILLLAMPAYADSIQLERGFQSVCMDFTKTDCPLEPKVQIDLILTVQPYVGPVWNSWFQTFLNGPAWEVIGLDGRLNGEVLTFSPTGVHGISWLPSAVQSPQGFWIEFKRGDQQSLLSFDSAGPTLLWQSGGAFGRISPRSFNPDAFAVPETAAFTLLPVGLGALCLFLGLRKSMSRIS